jgi:hypothetical protein
MGALDRLDGMEALSGATTFRVRPCLVSDPRIHPAGILRDRARRDGYLFVRGLVDPDLVSRLRARAVAACAGFGWLQPGRETKAVPGQGPADYEDRRFIELQQQIAGAPAFQEIVRWPSVMALLEAVSGRRVESIPALVCRAFAPQRVEATTPPHQDAFFLGSREKEFWVAWLPLVECPLELGPLAVLRGSHRGGLRAHACSKDGSAGAELPDSAVRQAWRSAPMSPGDVLLFHHLMLHRACPNRTSDEMRISADFRFRIC